VQLGSAPPFRGAIPGAQPADFAISATRSVACAPQNASCIGLDSGLEGAVIGIDARCSKPPILFAETETARAQEQQGARSGRPKPVVNLRRGTFQNPLATLGGALDFGCRSRSDCTLDHLRGRRSPKPSFPRVRAAAMVSISLQDLHIPFCSMHANSLPIVNQLGSIFYSHNRW
jgi:hypothetical protein